MVNIDHLKAGSLVKLGFNERARSVGVKRVWHGERRCT